MRSDTPHSSARLIDELVGSLMPVRPAPRPWLLAAGWALIATACVTELISARFHLRSDYSDAFHRPAYLTGLFALAGLSVTSALSGYLSGFPGRPRSGVLKGAIVSCLALYLGNLLWSVAVFPLSDDIQVGFSPLGIDCSVEVLVLALTPLLLLFLHARRLAPVSLARSGRLAGLAAAACGGLGVALVCPLDTPIHHLVWHGVPMAVLTALAWWLGPKLLRW